MWRHSWLAVLATLSAALMPSCSEGGQTGQPSVGNCGQMEVAPDSPYHHGTTPELLAHGFEGTHLARLVWSEDQPLFSSLSALDDYEDSIAITLLYEGEQAYWGCPGLKIPVTVIIETSASGISETGPGSLTVLSAKLPYRASLGYAGPTFSLSAELRGRAANVAPVGNLEPRQGGVQAGEGNGGDASTALATDPSLGFPGSSAAFPSPQAAKELFSRARPENW